MKLLNDIKRGCKYPEEDERFWLEHLLKFSESGLSGAAYCRMNEINTDRFHYWKKVLEKKSPKCLEERNDVEKSKKLLRVKIKEEEMKELSLCSVKLSNGLILQIHSWSVVEQILCRVC